MSYSQSEKQLFVEQFKERTKLFAVEIIKFCNQPPTSIAIRNIVYQLIRSASSTGANYRVACKARSKAEFHSQFSIVFEEAEEIIKVVSKARKSNSQ